MPRTALHTDDIKIDQRPNIPDDPRDREPEIIEAGENVLKDQDWLDNLKFNEEWVTVYLEPSREQNAAREFYLAVNGKGCEVLTPDGRTLVMPYVPLGMEITMKRKYVAVLVGAKIDTVTTEVGKPGDELVRNEEKRLTTPVYSFSVREDKNPLGAAWLTALRRKNM